MRIAFAASLCIAAGCAAILATPAAAGSWVSTRGAPVGIGRPAEPPLPVPRPHFPSDEAPTQPVTPPVPPAPPVPPVPPKADGLGPAPAQTPAATADLGCLGRLQSLGIAYEATTLGSQPNALCQIAEPVRLLSLRSMDGTTIALPDKPLVACETGVVFADFVHGLLSPLAKGSYGSPVAAVSTGPGFECRTRDHLVGAKISAHGQGLAIDIAKIALVDGRKIEIGPPATEVDRMFDKAARAGACGFFHTALGPGTDSFHETHWHFDLQQRGAHGETRICQ